MTTNTLTLYEAAAILRYRGYGGHVAGSLYTLALAVMNASKPVVQYAPVNWYEDDGSEGEFDYVEYKRKVNAVYDSKGERR